MTDDLQSDWRTAEERAQDITQAGALKEQARKAGLRFEAYLPPDLAAWVLDHVERGVFADPGEAVFVILGEHRDLEPHSDLRRESLKRPLDAAMNDPRPALSLEEVRAGMKKLFDEPRPEPAVWRKRSDASMPSLVPVEALPGMKTCRLPDWNGISDSDRPLARDGYRHPHRDRPQARLNRSARLQRPSLFHC